MLVVAAAVSSAAQVFKAQAMSAAGADATSVAPFEPFFSHGRPVHTDFPDLLSRRLTPVSDRRRCR